MQPLRPQAAQPSLGALGSAAFQALAAADVAPEADFFQKYQACSALRPVIMLSCLRSVLQTIPGSTHLAQCILCSSQIWGCPMVHSQTYAASCNLDSLYGSWNWADRRVL